MDTEDLIERLARDTRPISPAVAPLRIGAALIIGGALATGLLTTMFGEPFAAITDTGVATFGVKIGFTVATLLIGAILLFDSGRPGRGKGGSVLWLLAPGAVVAMLAILAMAPATPEARGQMLFGETWTDCIRMVFLLSLPIYGALVLAFRTLAPTRLDRAGMLAGLTAGSMSALIYVMHCPETSPAFLVAWYGLAIIGAGLVGRITGPALMRW